MWTRVELKDKAKMYLNKNYWMVVLVTFILMVISGGTGSVGSAFNTNLNNSSVEQQSAMDQWDNGAFGTMQPGYSTITSQLGRLFTSGIAQIVLVIVLIAMVIGIAFNIFLLNPLKVGCYKWYLYNRKENPQVGVLGDAFKNNYFGTVEIMFCKELFIFLWSLLLVIPGIIKSYEYQMVPYIIAENPNISRREAFEMSKTMMDGEKWNSFVLDMSFILWYFASGMCCGILGILYVFPYVQLTRVELYVKLKELHLGIRDDVNNRNDRNDYYYDGYREV